LNRLFTLISNRKGEITRDQAKELKPFLNALPPRPPPCIGTETEPRPDRPIVPRSRFVDQFYSHQLPGVRGGTFSDIRELIDEQRILQRQAREGTEVLNYALKNLTEAFPDVPFDETAISHATRPARNEDSPRASIIKALQCQARFMESSVAMTLEHTEHLTMNIQRIEPDASKPE
jgi:hypothetical protein